MSNMVAGWSGFKTKNKFSITAIAYWVFYMVTKNIKNWLYFLTEWSNHLDLFLLCFYRPILSTLRAIYGHMVKSWLYSHMIIWL